MADVFISYSREDTDFVRDLHKALSEQNRDIWVDWEDIPPTAEWLEEIYSAIEAAEAFIFVISPDSVASKHCRQEIDHAVRHNKRIVPVVHRDADDKVVPEALAKLNWIFFRESDDFDNALQTLIEAVDTDLDWVRAHTRLLVRAREWENKGHNKSFVLRGSDLRDAEGWLAQSAEKEPRPTSLQAQYIITSRKAATRRQRFTLGAVTFGLIVAVVLAVVALHQRQFAIQKRDLAEDRSNAMIRLHAGNIVDKDPTAALAILKQHTLDEEHTGAIGIIAGKAQERGAAFHVLRGHLVPVSRLLFSKTGQLLVSTDMRGLIRIWDLEKRRIRVLTARQGMNPPYEWMDPAVALSPDGRLVAFADFDGTIHLCETATGREVAIAQANSKEVAMVFAPDGNTIAIGAKGIGIWNAPTGDPEPIEYHGTEHGQIFSVQHSPDGVLIAGTPKSEAKVILWDSDRGEGRTLEGLHDPLLNIAFSSSGQSLAGTCLDGSVYVWSGIDADPKRFALPESASDPNVPKGKVKEMMQLIRSISKVSEGERIGFLIDDRILANTCRDRLLLWDVSSGKPLASEKIAAAKACLATNSAESRMAYTADGMTVKLLDFKHNDERLMVTKQPNLLTCMAFSIDGKILAAAGRNGDIYVWKLGTVRKMQLDDIVCARVAWSPSLGEFVAYTLDGSVVGVAPGDGKRRTIMKFTVGQEIFYRCEFSFDGLNLALLGESGNLIYLDLDNGRKILLAEKLPHMYQLLFLGNHSIVGYSDDGLMIWDVGTKDCAVYEEKLPDPDLDSKEDLVRALVKGRDSHPLGGKIYASPDGNIVVWSIGAMRDKRIIDVPSRRIRSMDFPLTPKEVLAISPDNRFLAFSRKDRQVELFDILMVSSRLLDGHALNVLALAFSPLGGRLVSTGGEPNVRVWDLDTFEGHAFRVPHGALEKVVLCADENTMLTWNEYVYLWDLKTGESRILGEHEISGERIDFAVSDDCKWVASINKQGRLSFISNDVPRGATALAEWLEETTKAVFNSRFQTTESPFILNINSE